MIFSSIIGHEYVRNKLNKSIEAGNLAHAHLIVGEDGIGKSFIAREAAVNILGKQVDKDYADIKEYRVSANRKSISIDQIRNIIEEINKKPYEGDKKILILHDADKMTIQAQNAFLKTIEEPPFGVYIILLSENIEVILDTIKSRCQIHKLRRLDSTEMNKFFEKKYPTLNVDQLNAAKAFSDGVPGRAEKFIENSSFKEIRDCVINILIEINKVNLDKLMENEQFLLKYKDMWQEVLTCFLSYVRDIMVYKETGIDELIINLDKIKDMKELAAAFSYKKLNEIIDTINQTRDYLEKNVNAAMVYDVMLLKIQEV